MSVRAVYVRTVRPVYVAVRDWLGRLLLDRRRGLTTSGEIELAELGFDDANRERYRPSGWRHLRRILAEQEITQDDVFIDLGSGMGRVVFQAAHYPFRRVIGVELSERLNRIARENIERNRQRLHCQRVELVTSDVLDYEIPDDVTVAYLYNPFTGPVLAHVIEGLIASVDRNPRDLRIIYSNPVEHDMLIATGRLREVRVFPGLRPTREWSRYSSTRVYSVLLPGQAASTAGKRASA